MTLACSNVVLDGAVGSKLGGSGGAFGFRNGASVPSVIGFLQRRRLSFGLVIHLRTSNRWKHSERYAASIKANLDRSAQPSQNEKDALADDGVSASRDSMEDTVGADAKDMLYSWVGDASSEIGVKNGSSGGDKEQKEIDDIEEQYLENDKLDGNESDPKNELNDARNRQTASETASSSAEGGGGVESPSAVLSSSPGRDWRVWAENGGRATWPTTETSETGEASGADFEVKQAFGWSESKCDKGSLLMDAVDGSLANAETSSDSDANVVNSSGGSNGKDQIAERLVSLEDLVIKKDNGRSAADYSRRADIFEKSNQVFTAKKKEADEQTGGS